MKRKKPAYIIRRLWKRKDYSLVKRIYELIFIESKKDHMLLRPSEEIKERISKGQVIAAFSKFSGEYLVGCCFFHPWSKDIVEICSLVVDEHFRRMGNGTSLIKKATSIAQELYPGAKIFCLTDATDRSDRAVEGFLKADFKKAKKDTLPAEVWKWCRVDQCSDWLAGKFPNCKCLVMVYHIPNTKAEEQEYLFNN